MARYPVPRVETSVRRGAGFALARRTDTAKGSFDGTAAGNKVAVLRNGL
jgi:hypothetical protein